MPRRDAIKIALVWKAAWQSANPGIAAEPIEFWVNRVRNELNPPVLVRVVGGHASIKAFIAVDLERRCLELVFVSPSLQSQGLGSHLLKEVCALMPGGWMLQVNIDNRSARRFYERHGLIPGEQDFNPVTDRPRITYHWLPLSSA